MKQRATADATALMRAMRGSITQIDMSQRLGVAQNTLSAVETGAHGRTPDVMQHYVDGYAQALLCRLLDAGDEWRFVAWQVCAVARIEPRQWSGPAEVVEVIVGRLGEALEVADDA